MSIILPQKKLNPLSQLQIILLDHPSIYLRTELRTKKKPMQILQSKTISWGKDLPIALLTQQVKQMQSENPKLWSTKQRKSASHYTHRT